MADSKISDLTALTGANVATDDLLHIVDTSATENKKITAEELINYLDDKIGKQYLGDGTDFTVTGTSWTTTRAVAIPYQTSDGAWRMIFNIDGDFPGGTTNTTITISGITFKAGFNQAICVDPTSGAAAYGRANGGVATISGTTASGSAPWAYSGNVELNAKPSWAD